MGTGPGQPGARDISENDPEGAYQLLYAGVRKALTAILANEGLRPTTSGGHRAVYAAVSAQLDPPVGGVLRPFDRMRRQRHESESPAMNAEPVLPEDVAEELPKAEAIIHLAERVLEEMSPF